MTGATRRRARAPMKNARVREQPFLEAQAQEMEMETHGDPAF